MEISSHCRFDGTEERLAQAVTNYREQGGMEGGREGGKEQASKTNSEDRS